MSVTVPIEEYKELVELYEYLFFKYNELAEAYLNIEYCEEEEHYKDKGDK